MTTKTTSLASSARRGFTLIELLVVIGIIVVLISILVPVVSSARRSANAADSRNQVKNIANAVDRYYNDFAAYPGIFSAAQVSVSGVGAIKPTATASPALLGNITSSEALVLSLLGGNGGTAAAPTFISTDVGRGVISYSTIAKRYSPYLEATPSSISMNGAKLDRAGMFGMGETAGSNTGIPEFIDRFPGALPIIYLRARVGGTASAGADFTHQYDTREFTAYVRVTVPAAPTDFSNDWNVYLTNSSLPGVAKQQDTYILISAGQDRIFGTADDICNFQF